MKELDIRVRSRLRQARTVANNNKRLAAEQLYRELLADEPELADAWVGLGHVLTDEAEQEAAYEKALSFDPDHAEAQRALGILRGEIVVEEEKVVAEVVEDVAEEMPASSSTPAPPPTQPQTPIAQTPPDTHTHQPIAEDETLYCANHPNKETNLRCNKCGKPVCSKCIERTPVGYRCKDCIRTQEDVYFSAEYSNYLIAAAVAIPLALIAAYIVPIIGFFTIFLGPAVGTGISKLAFTVSGRQRGRYLPHMIAGIIAGTAVLAILSGLLFGLLYGFFGGDGGVLGTMLATLARFSPSFIWGLLYAAVAASSAYYYMK